MFYSTWICLILIFGLINQSYEYNEKTRYRRHQKRESPMQHTEQRIVNQMISNEDDLKDVVRNASDQERQKAEAISRKILEAANLIATIATSGVINSTLVDKWSIIQNEIRRGINLVIQAYRTFINFHRQTCDSVETVAKNMISKYESELNLVDDFQLPSVPDYNDINREEYRLKLQNLMDMLHYAQVHASTLPMATTCPHAMLDTAYTQHIAVNARSGQTTVIHVSNPDLVYQNVNPRSVVVPCDSVYQYTNIAQCSEGIVRTTSYCACQINPTCSPAQQLPIVVNKKK